MQIVVIILYKIWSKSWFVSGFLCLFVLRTILLFIKVKYFIPNLVLLCVFHGSIYTS